MTPEPDTAMDGVLCVHKESGWTSHDVVAKLRGLLGVKTGHGGTLDPAATGVLPVFLGKATRIAEYLVDWEKEYRAVLRLGETTDTQDATGTVLERRPVDGVTPSAIRQAVHGFRGEIRQLPPMYSAVKVAGVPLYKSARAGKTVDREFRTVLLHEVEVLGIEGPDVTLRVVCSKGTYIRTLCADIGAALKVGGHMRILERRRVGPLTIERAMRLGDIAERHGRSTLTESLMSLDEALSGMPAVVVDQYTAERVVHGVPVGCEHAGGPLPPVAGPVRVKDESGRLLAVGRRSEHGPGVIRIEKVLLVENRGSHVKV